MIRYALFLAAAGVAASLHVDRALAQTPAALMCESLFDSSPTKTDVSPTSKFRGDAESYMQTAREMLPSNTAAPIEVRQMASQLARRIVTESNYDGATSLRVMSLVLTDAKNHYSKEWYEGFLGEMYKASHEFESDTLKRTTTKEFFQRILQTGLRAALKREELFATSGDFRPVLFYSRLVWLPEAQYSYTELKLRHHWKQKTAEPFASAKAAEAAGRKLAKYVAEHAGDNIHAYLRFNYIVLTQFRMNHSTDFYRGFLGEKFARTFLVFDANTQHFLQQVVALAGKENGIALAVPSLPPPTLAELIEQPVNWTMKTEAALDMIHMATKLANKNVVDGGKAFDQKAETENDVAQSDVGRKLAQFIEVGSQGDSKVFFKLLALTIKDNPRPLHPSAQFTFKTEILKVAATLHLPSTQIEALRRLLTESRSAAIEHMEELGWLELSNGK